MADDITLNKVAVIERCIARVREEYNGDEANLLDNITRQDSIILNLQRACEAAIDLAMHRVAVGRLGLPQDSRDAFALLTQTGDLNPDLAGRLQRMVGFRNVAVHDYQALNLRIVRYIIENGLEDLVSFTRWALARQ